MCLRSLLLISTLTIFGLKYRNASCEVVQGWDVMGFLRENNISWGRGELVPCCICAALVLNAVPQTSTEWSCSTTVEVLPVWTPAAVTHSASSWKDPWDRSAPPPCSTIVRTRKYLEMSSGVWCGFIVYSKLCRHFNILEFVCRLCCRAVGSPVWSLEVQWNRRTSSAAGRQHQRGGDLRQHQVSDGQGGTRHHHGVLTEEKLFMYHLLCCVSSVLMF